MSGLPRKEVSMGCWNCVKSHPVTVHTGGATYKCYRGVHGWDYQCDEYKSFYKEAKENEGTGKRNCFSEDAPEA